MGIKYRSVDAEATQTNVLRQRALDAEKEAYVQEVELKRLTALEKIVSTEEDKAALKEAKKVATDAAKTNRARVGRLNKDSAASQEDLVASKKEFLTDWIASLEGEHVSHTALLKQRQDSLATTGTNAPSEDDRERIQANIKINEDALKMIESAWNVATKELDSLK